MPYTPLILAFLIVVIWGFNFVAIKVGLEQLSPLLLCSIRFFLTSIPAVFFIKKPKAPLKMVMLYGLIMFALQFAFLFVGMYEGVAPGMASLLLQIQVFFTILLAVIFFNEKLNRWRIIGAIISFSGIAVVGAHVSGAVTFLGFIFVIFAALCWAVGNAFAKQIGKVNMISLVIWGSMFAWPPLLVATLIVDGLDKVWMTLYQLTPLSIGATLYITYLSTVFGYAAWNWLLHHYSLATIAPFTMLVPIVAMLSSILVAGEPFYIWKLIAAILVLSGVCINLFSSKLMKQKAQ
ncbi:MAG: EamA family transporter [Chlamydiales bacterium]|nr:EamA family transporter [Chlamydiales bacterium]